MKEGQEVVWVFLRPIAIGIIIGLLWSASDTLHSIRADIRRLAASTTIQRAQR